MKTIKLIIFICVGVGIFSGCNKFLEEKTDLKLVVPSTLDDLQALFDNDALYTSDPTEGEISSDSYYLTDEAWSALQHEYHQRGYTWEPDFSTAYNSWFTAYRSVYYANVVLDGLAALPGSADQNQEQWNNVAGQAYFMRARAHLAVQSIWAQAYDERTAGVDLGVPLRLNADFNAESIRRPNTEVYKQVIDDLKKAVSLLPVQSMHAMRASKPAAYALLARTHLFMRNYENCFRYADSCLQLRNTLLQYGGMDSSATYPIPQFNGEVIHHSQLTATISPIHQNNALIDTNLYALYHEDDLRRALFFRDNGDGTHTFKGSYSGSHAHFSGVAVDEVYLMRAECYARRGDVEAAMRDLNFLLEHRYREGSTALPMLANNADEALQLILTERRKELVFRGLRFPDVKRLNKAGADIAFQRFLNGTAYTLDAGDLRFALPIPEEVLEREPTITENPR